jgi:hypothetical protein
VAAFAGVGIAALAGLFATALPASASAQANPVSTVMIKAMTAHTALQVSSARPGAAVLATADMAQAQHSALAWLKRPGTQVLGTSLAYATVPPVKSKKLVWLVSLDPAGGMYSVGLKAIRANFCVAIIDARTGKWLMATVGSSGSLPALRTIP